MNRKLEQIISIPLWLLIIPGIATLIHWSMVKGNDRVKKLKKASYADIRKKMLGVEWIWKQQYPNSLFTDGYPNTNYFHAGVFRFGDVGYLLTPYGYIRASILQGKIRKGLPGYISIIKPYVD